MAIRIIFESSKRYIRDQFRKDQYAVLVQREVEFRPGGVSELGWTSCRDEGVVPGRFFALVLKWMDVQGDRTGGESGSAFHSNPWVGAPVAGTARRVVQQSRILRPGQRRLCRERVHPATSRSASRAC